LPKIKRRKLNSDSERKIITGIITSTDFLNYSRTVITWCLDYFEEYEKAPGIHIQDLFEKKYKKLDPDLADLLAQFLDRLSNEFDKQEESNPDYLIDESVKHLNQQYLKNISEDIVIHLDNGEIKEAVNLIKEYQPVEVGTNLLLERINKTLVTSEELFEKRIQKQKTIITPWLTYGSLNMIYAKEGVGKTMLTYILALAITRRNYDDIEIGPWQIKRPCGCLIIDGEMDEGAIKSRLKAFSGPLGRESLNTPLSILSASAFSKDHEGVNGPSIEDDEWREAISQVLINNPLYRVLILDNLFSLTRSMDLIKNEDWGKINHWLLSLRHLGVAVILLHHSGKSGEQLGASSRSFNLDNVLYLKSPKKHVIEKDGAVFEVRFEKGRDIRPGQTNRFTITIEEYGHKNWLTWTTN